MRYGYLYTMRKEALKYVIDVFTQCTKKRINVLWLSFVNDTCAKSARKGKNVLILIPPAFITVCLT